MPKHSRPPSRMHGIPENKNADSCWGKQPRPLENGNWVCEDPHCGNVNYPRRTECFKCRKRRGPLGDAIVKAFIDKMKLAKGDLQSNGFASPVQGMVSSGLPLAHNKLDPWLDGCPEQLPLEASHFEGEQCFLSRRSVTFSTMTEGKRLAEHLIACFAASSDPFVDAGECLTSAALWLQTMKPRFHTAEEQSLSVSSLVSIGSPFGSLSLGLNGAVNMLSQPHHGINMGPGAITGAATAINRPPSSLSNSSNARTLVRSSLKWEDYKDRPSDFLREFGDPAAVTAAAFGGGLRPEPGVNGNWECEDCKNVNFPRRTSCFQCRRKRGVKGDELVRKYVRGLFNDGDTIWST
ncbi:hypothetical protein L7F22_001177 [Adiantum nelumboides]|nr:hypothetical protein [Adiantum nelumboides]